MLRTACLILLATATFSASAKPVLCRDLGYTQLQDLRLAQKLQEGPDRFAQYVRRHKFMKQWSFDDALQRAHAASVTSCAGELGIRPAVRKTLPPPLR